jgi:DNA polymerase-3 subunit epsilon
MCVFDLETTSPDPEDARIVTAFVGLTGGGSDGEVDTWLVNPGIDIPASATAVHGITTEHAREHGQDPATAVREILAALYAAWSTGLPVLAYNAPFDLTVVDRESRRHGGPGLAFVGPVVDPFVIDRAVDPYRKGSRTLGATCAHYRVTLDGAHDATADAFTAAGVARAICWRFPYVAAMTLPELHAAQVRWHAERQASFAAYLRRVGKPSDGVCGDWPLRVLGGVNV